MGLVAIVLGLVAAAETAQATFQGPNGKIAFMSTRDGDGEIFVMDPTEATKTN